MRSEIMVGQASVTFTKEQFEILKKLVTKDLKNIFGEDHIEEKKILQELKFGLIKCKGLNK